MIRPLALACGMIAAALAAPAAFAHALLVRVTPPAGATVTATPPRLVLRYTEAVVPHFCAVALHGPGGALVPIGQPEAAPGHPRMLQVELPPLAPGQYRVTWHAVARDTHRTEGSYGFTVAGMQR